MKYAKFEHCARRWTANRKAESPSPTQRWWGQQTDGQTASGMGRLFETSCCDRTHQQRSAYSTHRKKKKNTRALSIAQQHYLNRSKRNVLNPEFKLQKKTKNKNKNHKINILKSFSFFALKIVHVQFKKWIYVMGGKKCPNTFLWICKCTLKTKKKKNIGHTRSVSNTIESSLIFKKIKKLCELGKKVQALIRYHSPIMTSGVENEKATLLIPALPTKYILPPKPVQHWEMGCTSASRGQMTVLPPTIVR